MTLNYAIIWNVQRVSCVHTQILEIGQTGNGGVTALIFYKGHLHAGYYDGSIKVRIYCGMICQNPEQPKNFFVKLKRFLLSTQLVLVHK